MRAALAGLATALALAAPAAAAPELVKVGDFHAPVGIEAPAGDPRLYVVDQDGQVILVDGAERRVFLDVRSSTAQGSEEGLLSIAFPPDHAQTGLFYVFQVRASHDFLDILEFRRDPADPSRADPASRRVVHSVSHTQADNHNGGDLHFGPDGLLYVSVGDGGPQNDPEGDAQNTGSELGKILRIDPKTGAGPAGNPFGNRVWDYGLRNPFRFSFDRQTGDMVIGDVGGGAFEEVNLHPAGQPGGRNFGWVCFEGQGATGRCANPPANHRPPAISLSHTPDNYVSVIGGVVVRDPQVPSLAGRYVYGDIGHEVLRSARLSGETAAEDRDEPALQPTGQVNEFGEDSCGRVYVGTQSNYAHSPGIVYRLQEAGQPSVCAASAPPGSPGTPGPGGQPAPDTRPCAVRLFGRAQRLARRKPRLKLSAEVDEPCTVTFRARATAGRGSAPGP
jgi:glucose/arabinose dehydrogenase